MKNFTKVALVIVLVLVILGSMLCAVGMAIGFEFSDFWEQVDAGEFSIGPIRHIPFIRYGNNDFDWEGEDLSWVSKEDADFTFPWESVRKIEMDVDYSGVRIVENTQDHNGNVHLKVEYRKKDHKRQIKAEMDGDTLKIEDNGSGRSWGNDSARVTLELPMELMDGTRLDEISLEQGRGYIYVNTPLTAKKISISVDAGECEVSGKLTAKKEMSLSVDAGELSVEELEAEKLEMSGGVGDLTAEWVQAEEIEIEGGVGSIELEAAGKETDYSYDIECGIGSVEIGDSEYSGLSSHRSIDNPGSRKMKIECGVGNVEVSFAED